MRKWITCFIVVMSMIFTFAAVSSAGELSIGAASWYAWWDYKEGDTDLSSDPAPMYGPVVSIGLGKGLSISSIFLMGRFDFTDSEGTMEIDRYDSDTSLNFNLNRYVKIFGGVKFMYYSVPDGAHVSLGPALGIGLTVPLGANFFMLGNVSGMYNFAWEEQSGSKSREPGVNSALSLAYYIEPASTTISLGGRVQYFRVVPADDPNRSDMDHIFYGITFQAVYSFGW